ncbi:MAG: exosortase/archaeosortase family protein [Bryobacteraceae bacterium]|jgi:exosortase
MSAGIPAAPEERQLQQPSMALPWAPILWFGLLLAACYGPVLSRLVNQWSTDGDMGHGFFVPVVAGYTAWQRRRELLEARGPSSRWGLLVIAWGAAQLYAATLGAELFLARTAFIVSLAGIVLFLGGRRALRVLAFPLFLLFFMVPIPAIIYNVLTFKLQTLASELAETALALLGVPVLREGHILRLPNQSLSVVEACSGIRSLLTLSFLSVVYAYFFDKKVWMRAVLLAAIVPIAIVANACRVTVSGLLGQVNPELAEGLFHEAAGALIFMFGLLLLVAVHLAINWGWKLVYGRK